MRLTSVSQKRAFGKALDDLDLSGDGFEFNLPPARNAQHANEIYDLLVTFFSNGGSEAISAVAGMIATAIVTAFGKEKDGGDTNPTTAPITIVVNDLDIEVSPAMTADEIRSQIEEKLAQTNAI